MTAFNPGISIRPIEYLFVDGGYLRKHLDEWSRVFFSGARIEVDFNQVARGFQKTFYYDCLPPQNKGELHEAYEKRNRSQFLKKVERISQQKDLRDPEQMIRQ